MKNFFLTLMCSSVFSCFAASGPICTPVSPWPPTDPNFNLAKFCTQFNESAYCHCSKTGLPYDYCKSTLKMKGIYKRMLDKYHSIENACLKGQSDIDPATCVVQWNYYLGSCQMPF